MDIECQCSGTTFVWHDGKAGENESKHGIEFAGAVTVFDDPLLVITTADRNAEERNKAIGFSATGKLLAVVHIEVEGEFIRIISAWQASVAEELLYDQ